MKMNLYSTLKPYRGWITLLVLLAVLSNGLNLLMPQIIREGINDYSQSTLNLQSIIYKFSAAAFLIFVFTYVQSIVQTYASERVAKDLRKQLSNKISLQSYLYVQDVTSSKLLTNLTSDVDAVKLFVSQAIVSIVSSIFLIAGSSILLLLINWKLALATLGIIPIIGGTFFIVLSKVRVLFKRSQEVIDWLNKVINESILGSGIIRVLNSQYLEYLKFLEANTDAKNIGMQILKLFAAMIPIITFVANMATVVILVLGGHFVIGGTMTLGDFAAFNSYLAILIFPILIIGFMSNVMARATASYQRIAEVLTTNELEEKGKRTADLKGEIELKKVSVLYGEKSALKEVSIKIKPGTRTAILGPTAAGKSQLLHLLIGLIRPGSGLIEFDGKPMDDYDKKSLHEQMGFVFQDSVLFNMTLRENIAFSSTVKDKDLAKAIETAELLDFIETLPEGLNTMVSERGTSLSGGQKQRIMLARALALNPRILILDDFTARVDAKTERKILKNIEKNYPNLTLISVTQKIAAVESFDQIILLMEGEVLSQGTHHHLMKTSAEYVQIAQSQRSTHTYELRTK
jgi:ATP-binding cassette subfamily B protein